MNNIVPIRLTDTKRSISDGCMVASTPPTDTDGGIVDQSVNSLVLRLELPDHPMQRGRFFQIQGSVVQVLVCRPIRWRFPVPPGADHSVTGIEKAERERTP